MLVCLAATASSFGVTTHVSAAIAPPAIDVQGDCNGITIIVSGYPTGTSVIVGVDSEPPYGFTFGEADPWGRFQPQSDGSVIGHLIPGNYAVTHTPFHVIADVVGSTNSTDYVVNCAVPVATTVPVTTVPATTEQLAEAIVVSPPEATSPLQDFTVLWASVELAPPW